MLFGTQSGEEFLFLYGFFPLLHNPHDTTLVRFDLSTHGGSGSTGRLLEMRERVLEVLGETQVAIPGNRSWVKKSASGSVALQLPCSLGPPDEPTTQLAVSLDVMRALVLSDADCFDGMGPARLGAWIDNGGGKYSAEVDHRALSLMKQLAATEIQLMQPPDAIAMAAEALHAVESSLLPVDNDELVQVAHLSQALRYVERRRQLLGDMICWCDEAMVGLRRAGVWWWKS